MQTLIYIGIFWGGLLVGIIAGFMLHHWLRSMQSFDGVMRVTRNEEKTVYSLELHEDPDMLAFKPEVIFKVITDLKIDPHREQN
jgi:hypothetical protein